MMGSFALVGSLFLGLALLSMLGLFTLFDSANIFQRPAEPSPILLVMPGLAPVASAAAPTPASAELRALVAAPLPVLTAIASNAVGDEEVETTQGRSVAGSTPTPPATYRTLFQEIGDVYGIDWRILAALAFRESTLNPAAVGRDGDMGLMQILPGTWREFAPTVAASEPFDARSNAEVAAVYLRYLQAYLDQLDHGEIYWVLVAYNWGPDNVRKLLANGGDWSQVPERQRHYAASILEAAFGVRYVE
jgi:soluble lytic murein transglycosylase-like protein